MQILIYLLTSIVVVVTCLFCLSDFPKNTNITTMTRNVFLEVMQCVCMSVYLDLNNNFYLNIFYTQCKYIFNQYPSTNFKSLFVFPCE